MYAETLGIAVGFSLSLKSVVFRYRPYAYSAAPAAFANPDIVNSFPSNHTTLAFASAIFAGYVFDSSHPDSPYRWAVWGAGLSLATTTAVLRVLSGDHFLSDVSPAPPSAPPADSSCPGSTLSEPESRGPAGPDSPSNFSPTERR